MALIIKDRVRETSTTTGTGTLTLAGATTGYQSFSTAIGNGNTTYYTISTPTGSEWEVGLGTVGAGTLARTTILASSNSGSAVNFSAGSKDVFGTYPAGKAVYSDIESDITINGLRVGKGGGAVATNTAVGFQAINTTATGNQNTAIGYQALQSVTSGVRSTAIGFTAGAANTTGSITAIGSYVLASSTGSGNTGVGGNDGSVAAALQANTSGTNNVAVGTGSLSTNTTGNNNTAVGYTALTKNTTGGQNVALGFASLSNNTTGVLNTASGVNSLQFNTTGNNNVAFGHSALLNNTTNVATLGAITGGSGYTDGTYTARAMTPVSGATFVTYPTVDVTVSGGAVTAVTLVTRGVGASSTAATVLTVAASLIGGTGSGFSIPVATFATGNNNTAFGLDALRANTTAIQNTAVGYQALLANTTGVNNSALGYRALLSNTTGTSNISLGSDSLSLNTTGSNNVAVGQSTLASNTTANNNVAVGHQALQNSTGTGGNVAMGYRAGNAITSGTTNTILGHVAAFSGTNNLTTGSNNIIIGYNAAASSATVSNEVTIGNSSITGLRIPGVNVYATTTGLGINTSSPLFPLDVNGAARVRGAIGGYASGAGVELGYDGARGYFQIYDRTASVYKIARITGSAVELYYENNVNQGIAIDSSNIYFRANTAERMRIFASGGVSINNTTDPGASNLSVTGNILSNGATGAIGYATGSGGAVTQATSRTTGVTLNKTNGAITLVSAAGLATYQSFTVTNSTVAATDTIIVNQKSGTDKYIILVTNVAAGSFEITFATTGGTTTEQPVFNFAVIKAVTA